MQIQNVFFNDTSYLFRVCLSDPLVYCSFWPIGLSALHLLWLLIVYALKVPIILEFYVLWGLKTTCIFFLNSFFIDTRYMCNQYYLEFFNCCNNHSLRKLYFGSFIKTKNKQPFGCCNMLAAVCHLHVIMITSVSCIFHLYRLTFSYIKIDIFVLSNVN